jgi:hypothetical protein
MNKPMALGGHFLMLFCSRTVHPLWGKLHNKEGSKLKYYSSVGIFLLHTFYQKDVHFASFALPESIKRGVGTEEIEWVYFLSSKSDS